MAHKSRIIRYEVRVDERGQFIPYCAYWRHPGVIKTQNINACMERGCKYFQRMRFEKISGVNKRTEIELNKKRLDAWPATRDWLDGYNEYEQ
jgi:hypothetical protein